MSASVSPAPFDEVSAAPMFSPASSSSSSRGTKKPRHSFIAKRRTSTVMNDQVGALEAFMAESTSIESDQEQKKQEPREEADRVSAPSFGCRAKLKYHMLSQMESERQQVLIIMMSTSIVVLLGGVLQLALHALIAIYQEDDELWIDPYLTFPKSGPLAFDGTGSGAGQVVSKYIWLFTAYLWLSWAFVVDPGAHIDVGLPWPLRICSVSISIFGILLFAAILGIVVDKIMSILESLRHGRTAVAVEGHTLLLNWTEKSDTLIVQLALSMLSEGGGTIVVLSESEKLVVEADMRDRFANVSSEAREALSLMKIIVRTGRITEGWDLRTYGAAHKAKAIVVLAQGGHPDVDDKKTMRVVLSLRNMEVVIKREHHKVKLDGFVVAELRDVDNRGLLKLLDEGNLDTMVSHDVLGRLMIKSARQPGLAKVWNAFLGFEGDEFYCESWPEVTGKTFAEVLRMFPDAVPIGVRTRQNVKYEVNDATGGVIVSIEGQYVDMVEPALISHLTDTPPGTETEATAKRSRRASIGSLAEFQTVLCPPDGFVMADGDELIVLAEDDDTYEPCDARAMVKGIPKINIAKEHAKERILMCGLRRDLDDVITLLDGMVAPGTELHIMAMLPVLEQQNMLKAGGLEPPENITIFHYTGSTSNRKDLEAALHNSDHDLDITNFDSVMILADEGEEASDPIAADSKSIATLLLLRDMERHSHELFRERNAKGVLSVVEKRELCEEPQAGGNGDINIVCEILDGRTRDIVKQNPDIECLCDFVLSNEIVAKVFAMVAEARECRNILFELLGPTGCEIELREGSTYLRDKQESVNFWELAARVRSLGDILIGYERTNDDSNLSTIIVNPKEADDTGVSKDTALEWSAGDKVIVLTPPRGKKMKTKANKTKKAVGSAKIDGLLSEEQIDLLDKSALRTALRASQRDLKRIRKGVSELTRPAL